MVDTEQNKEERLNQLLPDIDKAAKQLARRYPSIGYDDIRQDLCLYAWENLDKIRAYGEGNGNPLLVFSKIGNRLCGEQLASITVRTDACFYSPGEVRGLLESGALYMHHNDVVGRSDLLLAFEELSESDRNLIFTAFISRENNLGRLSRVLRRALDRLTVHMNQIGKPDVIHI